MSKKKKKKYYTAYQMGGEPVKAQMGTDPFRIGLPSYIMNPETDVPGGDLNSRERAQFQQLYNKTFAPQLTPEQKQQQFIYDAQQKGIINAPQHPTDLYDEYGQGDPTLQQRQHLGMFDTRRTDLNPFFKGFNALALGATAIGAKVNNVKTNRNELQQYLKALQPESYENMEQYGLNGLPAFTEYGGYSQPRPKKRGVYKKGGLSRQEDYGSKSKPYPSVSSGDFAGGGRSYPIPTHADAVDAIRLAHLHHRPDVIAKVHAKYPDLQMGGYSTQQPFDINDLEEMAKGGWIKGAINPAHKGYCTPMTKATCTPRRKALARRFKSGDLHKGQTGLDVSGFNEGLLRASKQKPLASLDYTNLASKMNSNRKNTEDVDFQYDTINPQAQVDANVADMVNTVIKAGKYTNQSDQGRMLPGRVAPEFIDYLNLYNQGAANLTPEQRIQKFYQSNPDNQAAKNELTRFRSVGYGPQNFARTTPIDVQPLSGTRPTPQISFQYGGGSIPTTTGLPQSMKNTANVEAEDGEVYSDMNDDIFEVEGNTHEQGGEMLSNVHRVLENTSNLRNDRDSKYLKVDSKQFKALTGVDATTPMSHAEALIKANDAYDKQREFIVNKITLAAKNNPDKYAQKSIELNLDHMAAIPSKQKLFDKLFEHQEAVKQAAGIQDGATSAMGGYTCNQKNKYIMKAQVGVDVGGVKWARDKAGDSIYFDAASGKWYSQGLGPSPNLKVDSNKIPRDMMIDPNTSGAPISQVPANTTSTNPGFTPYTGNKTGIKTPAGNYDAFPSNITLDSYLQDLKTKGFNYEGIQGNSQLQSALYDYVLAHDPQRIKDMWQQGVHQTGMAQAKKLGFVDDKGNFKPGVLDKPENLKKLGEIYPDDMLGVRTLQLAAPPRVWTDNPPAAPGVQKQKLDTSIRGNIKRVPKIESKFFEPLRWYDVASPINTYISALERTPEKYNPMEFNQLRYKLQDPTAALQQNQADFNAATAATQTGDNSGVQMANIANLASRKYAMNNQVLGNYENQNSQIKNNEILYNTQVRDKQSAADQQSREVFEDKVLTGQAKQQEQKLTAMDALYKTIAENKALNRNGNLIMKFARAFDQYGEYNGYQPQFGINPALGVGSSAYFPSTVAAQKTQPAGGIQGLTPGKTYYNRRTGKTMYFNGSNLIER